jgi:RHS repeat-associated protein
VAQGSLAVGLGYDNANRRTGLTYPNGTSTAYAYDDASRLTTINHMGPSGIIEALTYQYDAAGNRTSLTRNNAAASLLPNAVASATYDAANEQTAFAGATLTYDANGNLTNDGVNTYVWDSRNRLVSISGGATASFNYDAIGRRTSKVVNSVGSQFLYDGNDIAAEIGGGAVGASYLRSLNIDEPFVRQSSTGNEHYHTDALGSSLALSNAQGASAVTYAYEPFGKTSVTGTSSNAFQYAGRENDGMGLYYNRNRYYGISLSRFIREDALRFGRGGFNLYVYVANNPLRFIDPLGLERVEVCTASQPCIPVDLSDQTDKEHFRQSIKNEPQGGPLFYPNCEVFPTVCEKAVDKTICALASQACVYIIPDQKDIIQNPPQAFLPDPIGVFVPPAGAAVLPPILPINKGTGSIGGRK